ncbi:MAG TPA: TonB family protein [Burkholderiales bacterium]|nr:TonB family protein [Burkholderiales bacterium]
MKSARSFFGQALVLSLILHAIVIAAGIRIFSPATFGQQARQSDVMVWLRARLVEPASPPPVLPQLPPPREAERNANPGVVAGTGRPRIEVAPSAATAAPRTASPAPLQGDAAASATEQLRRELLYPREAIERGLQGEAVMLLFLDQSGNVIAARVEASSGYAILDDAAVRAVRSLRALPDSAPREALLPVRFRLR